MKRLTLILLFIFSGVALKCQQATLRDRIKAEHIFNFGVNINWKEKSFYKDSGRFVISVYGADTVMYNLLKRICRYRLLKWKKIEVKHFTKLSEITYTPILYVSYGNNHEVPEIDSLISEWPTLMITDSCNDYRNVMINFFPRNALKKVEVNRHNIISRGMKVNPLIYTLAKKYEEDWERLYQKSETELAAEKEIVEAQLQTLTTQEKEIKQKQAHIAKLFKEINEKETELSSQKEMLAKLESDISERNNMVKLITVKLRIQQLELTKQKDDIEESRKMLVEQMAQFEKQKEILTNQKKEIGNQQKLIDSQGTLLNKSIADFKKQQLVLYFVVVVLILIGFSSFLIFRSYRIKKRANKLLIQKNNEIYRQNNEIIQQKEEIETQRDEIEAQRDFLARQRDKILAQNKDITDSIMYASKIQDALLPQKILASQLFCDYFVLYMPRDIVSGDFYWVRKKGKNTYVAVADCTGHGVPGAFMSMLGIAFLNEIVDRHTEISPNALLDRLRDKIMYSLHQTGRAGASKDGMDIAVVVFNEKNNTAGIASANNSVYLISENELYEFKPDKMPIGFFYGEEKPFNSSSVQVKKGDVFYLFSDGFADQFGGANGKKLKYNSFKQFCLAAHKLPFGEQENFFLNKFNEWKGDFKQVDDVIVLGFKFI